MNSRRLSAYRHPSSQLGRLTLRGDICRKNHRHCTGSEPAVAEGEESQHVLNELIAQAQDSIEASRALISKLEGILRLKRGESSPGNENQSSSGRVRRPSSTGQSSKPPVGTDWVHEIKHDGYRIIVRRDGPSVRLYSRNANEWTGRVVAITAAAELIRAKSFTIPGEAVVLGPDRLSRFEELSRRLEPDPLRLRLDRA
jgi:hypothetical protein